MPDKENIKKITEKNSSLKKQGVPVTYLANILGFSKDLRFRDSFSWVFTKGEEKKIFP